MLAILQTCNGFALLKPLMTPSSSPKASGNCSLVKVLKILLNIFTEPPYLGLPDDLK